ncbi:MAG: RidA family protein [Acidobacteriota bacterium]
MHTGKVAATLATVLAIGWFAGASAQTGRKYIQPRDAKSTAAPFSGGVLIGDTFYLSGTLGLEGNQQVPASAEAEATNVLNTIQKTLAEAGMTMDDLVSVQVFCSDVSNYDAFNKVYRGFFKQEFPARAFLGSGKLLFGARFEVQGIAVKRR